MSRTRHTLLTLLCLLALLAISIVLTWRTVRQDRLDGDLIAAARACDSPAVLCLLHQGANPNARDTRSPHLSWWRLLVDRLRGLTPPPKMRDGVLQVTLTRAYVVDVPDVHPDNTAVVKALLETGADPNQGDKDGIPPLLNALTGDNGASVPLLLLQHGANVNARDNDGMTPLMYEFDRRTVHFLLTHGADVNATDKDGWTALHYCARYGDDATCKMLLDAGASIDARTKEGVTPLMMAAEKRQIDIVRLLLSRGTDITTKDCEGRTAWSYTAIAPGTLYEAEVKQNGGYDPDGEAIRRLLKQAGEK